MLWRLVFVVRIHCFHFPLNGLRLPFVSLLCGNISFELSSKPKRNKETSSQKHMLSRGHCGIPLHSSYPASRGFSLVFLSVVLPFSSRFWLLAFCFGCFCAEEKTSADSRLRFLLSMRCRYLQDLGGNHMTKPVVEPVLSTRSSFMY